MSDARTPQLSKTLEEFETILRDVLVVCGERPAHAEIVAEKAVEEMRRIYGGSLIYFPIGLGYETARRNTEIRRRHAAGANWATLRREFRLSNMQLRRIVGKRKKK